MPVVHRAHFHLDRPFLVLETGRTKSGHAQQQGNLIEARTADPNSANGGFSMRAAQGVLAGVLGVRGKFVPWGIAGTLSEPRATRRARAARLGAGAGARRPGLALAASRAQLLGDRARRVGRPGGGVATAGHDDQQHGHEHPDRRRDHRDPGEGIAGLGSEGARAAHAAKGPGQPAALAPLDQDQTDQEQRDQNDQCVENSCQNAHVFGPSR